MKKVIKSYAEKICSRSLISDIKIEEVKSKEPELFLNDNIVQAIRFYDIEYIIDKDKTYSSEKENVTNWIYYGRRMSVAELKRIYGNDPKYSTVISTAEVSGCEYVCITKCGVVLLMNDTDITFEEYISKKQKSKEKIAIEMFNNLKSHIGEEVSCTYYDNEKQYLVQGTLRGVSPFSRVFIGSGDMPFLNWNGGILYIKLMDGTELYSNLNIPLTHKCHNALEFFEIERLVFGDRIVDKKESEYKRNRELADKRAREEELEVQKKKYLLMKNGLEVVKKEKIEEWLEYADNCTEPGYKATIVETAIDMIKEVNKGTSFRKIDLEIERRGLTGEPASLVALGIEKFSNRGEEFKKYWDRLYKIDFGCQDINVPSSLILKQK